jgi:hypothetical protein
LNEWEQTFFNSTSSQVKEQIEELESKLSEWTNTFENRELSEVKDEWEDLKVRPNINLDEQNWWDDYSQRPTLIKLKETEAELNKKVGELTKTKEENWKLFQNNRKFLKEWLNRRYARIEELPTTIKQAREKVVELIKEVEEQWTNYLDRNIITEENIPLILSSNGKDQNIVARIYQVIAWIKEAHSTLDYEKLYERWNNGQEYNEEYDYDGGSLYLLGEYLKVKDFQPNTNQP